MFKPGDKAWHVSLGWGILKEIKGREDAMKFMATEGILNGVLDYPIFPDGRQSETHLNPVIFHKEQKFDLSEPEPEIGTWGYFWTDSDTTLCFGKLIGIINGEFKTTCYGNYTHFSPSLPKHIKDMMEGKG